MNLWKETIDEYILEKAILRKLSNALFQCQSYQLLDYLQWKVTNLSGEEYKTTNSQREYEGIWTCELVNKETKEVAAYIHVRVEVVGNKADYFVGIDNGTDDISVPMTKTNILKTMLFVHLWSTTGVEI